MAKIQHYKDIEGTRIDNESAKGVLGRVVVGKRDGARNFYMRVFEIYPGGNTPMHAHAWEHEMFIHSGEGEIFGNGKWNPVRPGGIIFVPPDETHQIRNRGTDPLVFACLIPAEAPEL